jgi:uncharacterized membrane protein HdeD (DUF308 family)
MSAQDALKSRIQIIPWWLVLLEGLALLILGVLLLAAPGKTLVTLVEIFGFYFLIRGVLSVVGLFVDGTQWAAKLVIGILSILVSIVVIRHPLWVAAIVPPTLSFLVGISAIVIGVVGLLQALQGGSLGIGLLGLLSVIIGLPFIFDPLGGTAVLAPIIGAVAIAGGIGVIVVAFRQK